MYHMSFGDRGNSNRGGYSVSSYQWIENLSMFFSCGNKKIGLLILLTARGINNENIALGETKLYPC